MSGPLLTPRARSDLRAIWTYSADRWGVEQADRYLRGIHDAMTVVADDPQRGRPCDEIRTGYRKFPVGSHVLFFRVLDTNLVQVVRVLHQSMDFDRHL